MSGEIKRTLTRQVERAADEFYDDFQNLYSKRDIKKKYNQLVAAQGRSSYASICAEFFRMLDRCGIKYEKSRKERSYYKQLIDEADLPSSEEELVDKFLYSVYTLYEKYPTPQEYMLRMVNRLSQDKEWETDTLRVRILKQFIKYGNYLEEAGYQGKAFIKKKYVKERMNAKTSTQITEEEVLSHIRDDIFDVLEKGNPNGTYDLLELADELAKGKFKTNQKTKKVLYLFALVFGMKYTPSKTDQEAWWFQNESDIEKNLFQDYYVYNLKWYLTEGYDKKREAYDRGLTGQGINYKNFGEVVYLYFLSKDYEPNVKYRLAVEMINRLKEKGDQKEVKGESIEKEKTEDFRDNTYLKNLFSKSEEEFEYYVSEHYHCSTTQKNEVAMETEQHTAYRVYQELRELLDKELKEQEYDMQDLVDELWLTDILKLPEGICDKESFQKFLEEVIYDFTHKRDKRKELFALTIPDPKQMARTWLLITYDYYYAVVSKHTKKGKEQTFQEFWEDFEMGANEYLEEAFYQPLSKKNIFDILTVFSVYAAAIYEKGEI